MAPLEIVNVPDPRLREKSIDVSSFGPALRSLAKEMVETMIAAEGAGLAGPQIGLNERLFVMLLREDDPRVPPDHPLVGKPVVVVNPEIIEASDEREEGMEGCLSIPGYAGLVDRHRRVVVQGRNEWGKPKRYEAEGFVARVMQHEIDHLDGILFLDRLTGDDKLFKVTPLEEESGDELPADAQELQPQSEL